MPMITYVEHDGTRHVVDVRSGLSVMQGAVHHMVPGIDGDCGGMCACGTCHVYVPSEWQAKTGEADELESNILDFAFDVQGNSRLACQINITDELDGMLVLMPKRQY